MSNKNDPEYAHRLVGLQDARWKLLLDVQRPYRHNIAKHCTGKVLEVGCGTGRNLRNLRGRGVGVDINDQAVAYARSKGFEAFTTTEFADSDYAVENSFDSLLMAHVLEHLDDDAAQEVLDSYLPYVRPGGVVMLICPQERGFASDATHVRWVTFDEMKKHATRAGLIVSEAYSFPFPRSAGKAFVYNEFCVVAGKIPEVGYPR
jgi:SAM-dependent methyltransferase